MSEPLVLVRDEGPVRWLTLNRPDQRNALSGDLVQACRDAFADAQESSARCIALTGAGKVFSSGADLKALKAMRAASLEENTADSRALADLLYDIQAHPLPVIAAVNGHAIAGGSGLTAACDLTVAVEGALFGFTEVRIGFVPAIVLNFLLRTVGEKTVRDLALTGRRLPAGEALALGLINEVCDAGGLAARIAALGAEFQRCSPEAIAHTKRLILELGPQSLRDGLTAAARANAEARRTSDCQEGVDAFLAKRPPRWAPPA
ncbi:MAG: enoyl-CoA hydratase-related protein [Planctomycetota bacterium]